MSKLTKERVIGRLQGFAYTILETRKPGFNLDDIKTSSPIVMVLEATNFATPEETEVLNSLADLLSQTTITNNDNETTIGAIEGKKIVYNKLDPKLLLRKEDIISNEQKKDEKISGWLAFFLWVSVGLSTIVNIIITAINSDVYAFLSISPLLLLQTVSAVLTIYCFYKRKGNAIACAYCYLLTILFFAIINLIGDAMGVSLSEKEIISTIRSLVWVIIWFVYLYVSKQVERIIPINTRYWGKLSIILISSIAFVFSIYIVFFVTVL